MDHLLHLRRTLDELDPPRWPPPAAESTRLVRKIHALRRVPVGELRPADLLALVSQQVALPHVLPLAVRLLLEEPLLDAYYYEGDLLLAAAGAPASAWAALPDLAGRLRLVITALPQATVADLPPSAAAALTAFTTGPRHPGAT